MQFIRDNLFYVVLVSATLLVTGVILIAGSSAGSDADAQLVKRSQADQTLSGFQRDLPTKGAVAAEKERVARVDVQAKRVEEATLKWNRGDYAMFETQDFKVEGKPFPAFCAEPLPGPTMTPEKLKKWRDDSIGWQKDSYSEHTWAYISLMMKLVREELRSTMPPTAAEVGQERETRLFRLRNERAENERLEVRQKLAGAARTSPEAAPKPGEEVKSVHQFLSRTETPEAQAETDAKNQLTVSRSADGYVYVNWLAFNPVYPERQTIMLPGDRAKLWAAWIHYRVCRDITLAIRDTVAETVKAAGGDLAKATVPQSPVKRVVDVQVHPFPYTGGPVTFSDSKGAPPGIESASGQAKAGAAPSLTGRISNTQYDVIRYQFTVVMADKYAGQLIERLYRQNDHFVLSVRMEPADSGGGKATGGTDRSGPADTGDNSLCYYGVTPVMRVTFDCELLMRTGWCRDLMPEEVLTALKSAPGVLRPQDLERLARAAVGRGY